MFNRIFVRCRVRPVLGLQNYSCVSRLKICCVWLGCILTRSGTLYQVELCKGGPVSCLWDALLLGKSFWVL